MRLCDGLTYLLCGHELDLYILALARHERASGGHHLKGARLGLVLSQLSPQVHGHMLVSLCGAFSGFFKECEETSASNDSFVIVDYL